MKALYLCRRIWLMPFPRHRR